MSEFAVNILFALLDKEKKDVLFVAGDAGFINSYETKDSILQSKQYLNKINQEMQCAWWQ